MTLRDCNPAIGCPQCGFSPADCIHIHTEVFPGKPMENPKYVRAQKDGKTPFEQLVWEVLEDEAWVLQHGADKYGFRNWLRDKIRASTYVGAISRHLAAITRGEWEDPDSGKPHLAHIRACCTVWQHADMHGMCIDDLHAYESKEQEGD